VLDGFLVLKDFGLVIKWSACMCCLCT